MANNKIPGWILEKYLLGELPDPELKKITHRLKNDPNLQAEIEKLTASNRDILNKYPADSLVPGILNRCNIEKNYQENDVRVTRARPTLIKRMLYLSPAFASLLVIIFIGLQIFKPGDNSSKAIEPGVQEGTNRVKGSPEVKPVPHLIIHRKGNNIEVLEKGSRAQAGDLLQLAYAAAGEAHGVICSIDGSGAVTLLFPDKKNDSTALMQRKKVLLANAYELDDAPGFERFFFITSEAEIDVEDILKRVKALANDSHRAKTDNIRLPHSFKQFSILIIKGVAPPTHSRSARCRSFGGVISKACFFCRLLQDISKKRPLCFTEPKAKLV
jgi:hypothetical protein